MKRKIFIIWLILIIFVWVWIYYFSDLNEFKLDIEKNRFYNPNNCEIKSEKYIVKWLSMQPLINNWDEVDLLLNYYNCWNNKIESWDIVIFENNFRFDKIIKQIKIIPWNSIELNYASWTVSVNSKLLKNSENNLYIFSKKELDFLNIYLNNGKMSNNNYYLLGDNISWSIDSRTWWPISIQWILWKVDLSK